MIGGVKVDTVTSHSSSSLSSVGVETVKNVHFPVALLYSHLIHSWNNKIRIVYYTDTDHHLYQSTYVTPVTPGFYSMISLQFKCIT